MIPLDEAAEESGDAACQLGIALLAVRKTRAVRAINTTGALGSSFSVGSSTDSPPTPESKKRMGAEGCNNSLRSG